MIVVKNKFYLLVIILIFLYNHSLFSQVVYEPLDHNVYNYLTRVSQKGLIEFNDLIRPLPRTYIAAKLLEIDSAKSELSNLEKEELEFLLKDYYQEFLLIKNEKNIETYHNLLNYDPAKRWRFFSFSSNDFKLNAGLMLGINYGSLDGLSLTHLWNGIYTYGYLPNKIGFSFDFRDNTETGKNIDKNKDFTPTTGVIAKSDQNTLNYPANKMEYNEAKMSLSTDWGWGNLVVGKGFIEWGYGDNGLIVLSQKAPSFPFIRLDIHPVDWLTFNYFHGWLSSDVIDSTNTYYSNGRERFSFRKKFLASHTLTLKLIKGLDVSIGESMVYSDNLEILYLIPITFFKTADHYLSNQYNGAGSNSQFFASISSRGHLKNTHLYGSLLIDEITINGLFNSYNQRNQIAFTLGGSITDLPIENLTMKLEYTKIYPYVYQHFISTTTYESSSYVMGHWMNNNADQIYASLNYRFLRGLESSTWIRYIRQGEKTKIEDIFVQPQPPFLSGLRTNYSYFGCDLHYEILHELIVKARYELIKSSKQNEDLDFININNNDFQFSLYYGL